MTSTRPLPAARAFALVAALTLLVGAGGVWGAGTADATSYRYWSYWLGGAGGWNFATQGAARSPADGSVDGWRFAVSEASSSTVTPRREPSFAQLCGTTAPVDGHKRVGLVVDFGTANDAPDGEAPPALIARCVVVPDDANGYEVLAEVVSLRTKEGLICGLNGYPAAECGAPVADPPDGGGGGGDDSGDDTGPDSPASDGGGGDDTSQDPTSGGNSNNNQGQNGEKSTSGPQGKERNDKSRDDTASPTSDAPSPVAAPATAADSPAADASGSPTGVLAGVALIAAIVTAGVLVTRRRR